MHTDPTSRRRSRALRGVVAGLVLACAAGPAAAQPAFYEPAEHYYRASGRGVSVAWDVRDTVVEEGRDLVATLVITGATNPAEVTKPDLKKLAAFDTFAVTPVPDPPRTPGDPAVRFAYKFGPRTRAVDRLPALEFYYFNPSAAPGKKQFPYTLAYSVPITVTERPPPPPIAMTEPDHLFHTATGPAVLGGPFEPCRWAWAAAALFGPLVAAGWFLAWRRVYPDAQRLARMRRSRAARRAVAAVRRAGGAADPPAAVAGAVLAYLRSRFPVPESAATPPEVAAALADSNVPPELCARVADVFRACDRARFAPAGGAADALAADAEAAVTALEELA